VSLLTNASSFFAFIVNNGSVAQFAAVTLRTITTMNAVESTAGHGIRQGPWPAQAAAWAPQGVPRPGSSAGLRSVEPELGAAASRRQASASGAAA